MTILQQLTKKLLNVTDVSNQYTLIDHQASIILIVGLKL